MTDHENITCNIETLHHIYQISIYDMINRLISFDTACDILHVGTNDVDCST